MKNFKFRAWDKDHKYMEYTDKNLIVTFGEKGIVNATDLSDIYSACEYMQNYELMQSTGLKDNDGIEFYKKDIVRNIDSEELGVVEYDEGQFRVSYNGVSEQLWEIDKDLQIIGNIYENPELLEGE